MNLPLPINAPLSDLSFFGTPVGEMSFNLLFLLYLLSIVQCSPLNGHGNSNDNGNDSVLENDQSFEPTHHHLTRTQSFTLTQPLPSIQSSQSNQLPPISPLKGKHRPSASQWPMPLSPWSDLRREVSDGYASSPGSASPPQSVNGPLRRRKGKGKLVDSEYSIPVLSSEERFSEGTESPLTVPGKGITFVDERVLDQIGIAGGSGYSDGGCTEELFWIRRDSSIPDYDTSRMERK